MTNKHTPGPWFIDTSLHVYGSSEPRPLDGVPGGTVIDNPHVCTAKTCADAHLIAAAPMLLESLQLLCQWREVIAKSDIPAKSAILEDFYDASAAISKATGQ